MLFSEPKIPQNAATALTMRRASWVSVLFSEPKIPQNHSESADRGSGQGDVSVLFSEPKIPQKWGCLIQRLTSKGFSALQRAENSSKDDRLNVLWDVVPVSVLFSEPKIPQN